MAIRRKLPRRVGDARDLHMLNLNTAVKSRAAAENAGQSSDCAAAPDTRRCTHFVPTVILVHLKNLSKWLSPARRCELMKRVAFLIAYNFFSSNPMKVSV